MYGSSLGWEDSEFEVSQDPDNRGYVRNVLGKMWMNGKDGRVSEDRGKKTRRYPGNLSCSSFYSLYLIGVPLT